MPDEKKSLLNVDVSKVDLSKLGRPLSKLIEGLDANQAMADGHDHYKDKGEHDHYKDGPREYERGR